MRDIRTIIAIPDGNSAAVKRRYVGQRVEVLPVPVDANGALSVRILDGPDEGRELWLHPTLLRLRDVGTENEW